MPVIRLILLVTILGGLTLLLAYNWSPALPLRFFGMNTQKLPLAIWILLGTTAGAGTTLFISSLFGLSNYFGKKSQPNRVSQSQRPKVYRQGEPAPRPTSSSTVREDRETETRNSDNSQRVRNSRINRQPDDEYEYDDWDLNRNADNWEFDQEEETPPPKSKKHHEQPKNTQKSSSTYSYGYKEPKGSSVGKTESIYDADYRVIIPPYPSSPTEANTEQKYEDEDQNRNGDDDDWGIFEEDDENEDQASDNTQDKKPS